MRSYSWKHPESRTFYKIRILYNIVSKPAVVSIMNGKSLCLSLFEIIIVSTLVPSEQISTGYGHIMLCLGNLFIFVLYFCIFFWFIFKKNFKPATQHGDVLCYTHQRVACPVCLCPDGFQMITWDSIIEFLNLYSLVLKKKQVKLIFSKVLNVVSKLGHFKQFAISLFIWQGITLCSIIALYLSPVAALKGT